MPLKKRTARKDGSSNTSPQRRKGRIRPRQRQIQNNLNLYYFFCLCKSVKELSLNAKTLKNSGKRVQRYDLFLFPEKFFEKKNEKKAFFNFKEDWLHLYYIY